MKMEDLLACFGTVIDHQPEGITTALISGNFSVDRQQMAEERFIRRLGVGKHGQGLLGNDQDMDRGLGVDIPESQAAFILMDYVGRYLPVDDLAEYGF